MSYITPVDFPVVPSNLLDSIDDILYKNVDMPFLPSTRKDYSIADNVPAYDFTRKEINPDLYHWLKINIPFKLVAQYQIMTTDMPIHKDKTVLAYNYLISAGGANVLTNMFDETQTLVESICMPEFKWFRLNTLRFHNVIGVEPNSYRIALSLRRLH